MYLYVRYTAEGVLNINDYEIWSKHQISQTHIIDFLEIEKLNTEFFQFLIFLTTANYDSDNIEQFLKILYKAKDIKIKFLIQTSYKSEQKIYTFYKSKK